MKKSKKSLLISGLLVATMGMGAIAFGVKENILPNFTQNKLMAYQYNPSNILDNVFTQDGMTILPFIYENSEQTVSKKYIEEQFIKAGIPIKNISTEQIVTGTKIETERKTYTILIYGDANGDGYVNVFDAQKVILHYVDEEKNPLSKICYLAANVNNHDDQVNVFDAQKIIQFFVGYDNKLVSKEPTSDKEKDKEKPVITLVGENPQRIKLGDPYRELGANVTDNMDTNIQVQIDASKVNTNKVGTYQVTYNAKDASGNKAVEVKRTVVVEDFLQKIEVTSPNKTTYQLGEAIDLSGGKINIVYASGKITSIAMEETMIRGYDANAIGTQTITVTYEGKEAIFMVTVLPQEDDYITDIEIIKPNKTTYKIGQTLDLTGAKLKKVMHSGAITTEEAITPDMIDQTELNTLGEMTITISYQTNDTVDGSEMTFKKTFNVQVQNYVKEIILTPPTKINYKYHETINTDGMIVEAVMGDGSKVDVTSQASLNVNQVTLDTNEVTVAYQTNNTLDDQIHTFEKTFAITVENYIQDIELVSSPNKTNYVEGQTIQTEGMSVKVVKANGDKEEISLEDTKLKITPNIATYGNNTITVSYTTNNTSDDQEKTFEKTFTISVMKKIEDMIVTEQKTTGYRYTTFTIAKVKSGENQEAITTENLTWEIKNENGLIINQEAIAKVTAIESQFDGTVELNFTASIAGAYTITPKVGNVQGSPVVVTIDENPVVTKMTIDEIGEKFRVGQTRTVGVSFLHEYSAGNEAQIDVIASRIQASGSGLEVALVDETGTIINVAERPNAVVKTISVKAVEEGEKTLKVIVNNENSNEFIENKVITILPEAKIAVKVDNLTEITLYLQAPADNPMVKEENGFIYSLIPMWLEDEDGIQTKVKLEDITTGKISILDSLNDPSDPFPSIQLQAYKKVGENIIKVTNGTDEIDYIGIALLDEQAGEELRNGEITISYQDSSVVLAIDIPRKTISNIVVTEQTTTGHRYNTFAIAKVKAGQNEEDITEENLTWEIKDSRNQLITDKSIAKITVEPSQFDGQIEMSFTASIAGTYTITPKVGDITGSSVVVIIDENPIVTKITVGDIGENFRIGQTRTMDVSFIHEYQVGNESEINVEARRIKAIGTGLECSLIDENSTIINPEERPNAIVKGISIKAVQEGSQAILITVDEGSENKKTETKNIMVLPEAKTEIKVNGLTDITLYLKNPYTEEFVQQDNGYLYTLIPVWLENEDGRKTKISTQDIIEGKVKILDSQDDPDDPFPLIQLQGYKKVGENITKVANATEEMDYIGIALLDEQAGEDLRNGHIIFLYGESTQVLNITIPKKEITNIIVTENITTGYRYDTITIGKVKSGLNEEDITTENLNWEIRDDSNHLITDDAIAKVTVQKAQFEEQIEMQLTASVAGIYTITPKVGSVTGNPITVAIDENPIVSRIEIGEVSENFRVGQTKTAEVTFIHEYEDGNESEIGVEAGRMKIIGSGFEYTLLDQDHTIINVDERPNDIVKYLSIKAIAEGTQTLSITIDEGSSNEKIQNKDYTILPEAKPQVKVNGLTNITLYTNKPMDNEMVKEEDGFVYTLLPIWLEDEEGTITKIKTEQLTAIKPESGKISILDNLNNDPSDPFPSIQLQGYKIVDGVIEKAGSAEEIDYVGIAFAFAGAEMDLADGMIIISTDGMENPIQLAISVQN